MLLNTLLQPYFIMVLQCGYIIIYLTDFSVIGHLFSPKFLSIISNVMIDNFEHKFYKAVFNTILFYMYGRSCPKYLHFAMFLLCVL